MSLLLLAHGLWMTIFMNKITRLLGRVIYI